MKKRDLDNILDRAVESIRGEHVEEAEVKDAADRVWLRLSGNDALGMSADRLPDAGAPIEGCADFQSLIPAYLRGELAEARSLLLVDHTHECIPCRKAMNEARARRSTVAKMPVKTKRYSLQPVV